MFNKGAMFGLDARIALAIFGALSVISGAALYSAIQDSKVTAIITEVNEVVKAWEQYMLDTGHDLPLDSSDASNRQRVSAELISSADTNWKGPYLSRSASPRYNHTLAFNINGDISTPALSNLEWGLGHASYPNWSYADIKCNDTTIPCYFGIQFGDATNSGGAKLKALAPLIDQKVDNGDGPTKGKLRWYECCGTEVVIALLYTPYPLN
jgi:hypothetical protein